VSRSPCLASNRRPRGRRRTHGCGLASASLRLAGRVPYPGPRPRGAVDTGKRACDRLAVSEPSMVRRVSDSVPARLLAIRPLFGAAGQWHRAGENLALYSLLLILAASVLVRITLSCSLSCRWSGVRLPSDCRALASGERATSLGRTPGVDNSFPISVCELPARRNLELELRRSSAALFDPSNASPALQLVSLCTGPSCCCCCKFVFAS